MVTRNKFKAEDAPRLNTELDKMNTNEFVDFILENMTKDEITKTSNNALYLLMIGVKSGNRKLSDKQRRRIKNIFITAETGINFDLINETKEKLQLQDDVFVENTLYTDRPQIEKFVADVVEYTRNNNRVPSDIIVEMRRANKNEGPFTANLPTCLELDKLAKYFEKAHNRLDFEKACIVGYFIKKD